MNSGVGHSGRGDYDSQGKGEWRVLQKSSSSLSVLLQRYWAAAVLCRYIGSATCRAIAWIMVQEQARQVGNGIVGQAVPVRVYCTFVLKCPGRHEHSG